VPQGVEVQVLSHPPRDNISDMVHASGKLLGEGGNLLGNIREVEVPDDPQQTLALYIRYKEIGGKAVILIPEYEEQLQTQAASDDPGA
jgi:hypothetical protein